MNKTILFLIIALFSSFVSAEIISSEKLLNSPTYNMAKLSPNGKYLSIQEKIEGKTALTLLDIESTVSFIAVLLSKGEVIQEYVWLNDKQIYLKIKKNRALLEYIYDFNPLNKSTVKKFNLIKDGSLVNWLPKEDDFVLVSKQGNRNSGKYQLYKILIDDLKNNNFENALLIDKTNRKILRYFYDEQYKRIITSESSKDNKEVVFKWRSIDTQKWQLLFSFSNDDYQISPIGFINEEKIAVLSNRDTDKVALYEFGLKTQTLGKLLFQHPKYDLTSAEIGNNGVIRSVHFYQKGIFTKHYFNQLDRKFSSRLAKTFKGQTYFIIDSDKSDTKQLIFTISSSYPGAYFLYDKSKDKIIRLYEAYPDLEKYSFSETIYIPVISPDGTALEAFLTKPKSSDHNTLLVMPHGGPIGIQEVDHFNSNVQFLANRGFTVLRVNFRGSSGFGKAFMEQGVGQFGQLIEQDITAAVNKTLELGQYKHVCSVGSSYGGYSSVMLAMKKPEQYQCVVAAYGIYDLPLLFNTSNYRSGKEYHDYIAKVLGKLDSSHRDVSTYMFEKLQSPLLLIAGKNDAISGIEQSNRFHYLLKKENKAVETIFYNSTGHGHSTWWGERHEMASIVDFLNRTLSLRQYSPDDFSQDENEALALDYMLLADSYDFKYKVSKDPTKAYDFYMRAAEYKNSRALFNVGAYYHRGELVKKEMSKALNYYEQSAELNYAGAHRRLGRMYMEGEFVDQDFDKAFQYLSKAYELDDSVFNLLRLARFYCVSNDKYKDVNKCLEHFNIKDIESFSDEQQERLYDKRRTEIASAFVDGEYSSNELEQLQNFIKVLYRLTHTSFDLDVKNSGVYVFEESERFDRAGEYVQTSEGNNVQAKEGEDTIYGLYFNIDFDGINSYKDRTGIIANWIELKPHGKSKVVRNSFLMGNANAQWSAIQSVSIDEKHATYRLELFNLNRDKVYIRDFVIN
jgi:dipeptidyl aminopeptidase/acylaminoacyl peptidase